MTRVTEFPGPRTRPGLTAAALAGVAVAAAAALSACGTGQVNQTAYMQPTVAGVNETFNVIDKDDQSAGSISLRNMLVTYDGSAGYKAGANAPLQVGIFNDTAGELKVTVTAPGAAKTVTFKTGTPTEEPPAEPTESPSAEPAESASAKPSGSAKPRKSAKPSPSAAPTEAPQPPSGPATLTIPSGQFVMLSPDEGKFLLLQGLTKELKPGGTLDGVTFQFQLDNDLSVVQQPAQPDAGATPNPSSCLFTNGNLVCRAPLGTPHVEQPRVVPTGLKHE